MRDPQLTVTKVVKVGGHPARGARPGEIAFDVTVSAAAPAAFAWAETKYAGRWSDNALLVHEPAVVLTFFSDSTVNGDDLSADDLAKTFIRNKGTQTLRTMQGGLWSLMDTHWLYTSG